MQPLRVTKQVLLDLRQSSIGDQTAKFNLYKENRPFIESIINYQHYTSLKLDILLILTHLDEESCRELGKHGTEIFVQILEMQFPSNAEVEEVVKYVKLRRICMENCREAETKEEFFFQDFYYNEPLHFFKKAVESLISTDQAIYREIVLEYMRFLSTMPFVITSQELSVMLKRVLRFYVNKYLPTINFKYAMVKAAKPSFEFDCDIFYDPNNTDHQLIGKKEKTEELGDETNECYESLPQCIEITDAFDIQLIFIISNLLTVLQTTGGRFSFLTDTRINIFYASLIRHSDIRLKTSALSFFYCQLENSWYSESNQDCDSSPQAALPFPIKLWLPTLISTLNEPELPRFFSPLEILSTLATQLNVKNQPENIVIDSFFDSNMLNGMIDTFLKLLSLKSQNTDKLQLLSDYLKFFSELIGKDERCRLLFLEHNAVLQYMENAFSTHLDLVVDFHQNYKSLSELAPLPPLFDSELVTNWAKCLKSCSRSVGVLRTSLKRNKLAEFSLKLAKEVFSLVSDTFNGEISELLNQELILLGELLGAMSNFVVEFSSLRTLMKKNGIISLIKNIFDSPLFNAEYLKESGIKRFEQNNPISKFQSEANIAEQMNIIQTNSLWVLRHLIYNSETCDKLELLSEVNLESILQFVNVEDPDVLNQCFQLLRNLTCNSRKVINMILERFRNIELQKREDRDNIASSNGNRFLEFLAHKLRTVFYDDKYYSDNKIAEALLYIVVNFSAINEYKRNLIIEQDDLLEIVKEYIIVQKGDEITKACIWIITNLIWDSSIQHSPYNNSLPENGNPHFEGNWARNDSNSFLPVVTDTEGDAEVSLPLTTNFQEANMSEEDEDIEEEIDPQREFVRGSLASNTVSGFSPALERFKKLDRLGFSEAVKQILDWNGDLDVKERAKTLLYQMETFRKSQITN